MLVIGDVLEGPIRQIGHVVRDLDDAMQSWAALSVGPWFTMRNLQLKNCRYRGEISEPTISIALANSGTMQIELIQQHDETPSIYREFLEAGHEGFHQLAWWVADFDAMTRKAARMGWPIVWSGEGGDVRFVYFELDPRISTVVDARKVAVWMLWPTRLESTSEVSRVSMRAAQALRTNTILALRLSERRKRLSNRIS
jgi:hypothetical protein